MQNASASPLPVRIGDGSLLPARRTCQLAFSVRPEAQLATVPPRIVGVTGYEGLRSSADAA